MTRDTQFVITYVLVGAGVPGQPFGPAARSVHVQAQAIGIATGFLTGVAVLALQGSAVIALVAGLALAFVVGMSARVVLALRHLEALRCEMREALAAGCKHGAVFVFCPACGRSQRLAIWLIVGCLAIVLLVQLVYR